MPTFTELHQRLLNAKFRKAILTKLIEHLDETYLSHAGADPKFFLITDDQVKVPQELFESVIQDTLTPELQQLDAEIAQINATEVASAAQPAPGPAKKSKTKKTKEAA